MHPPIVRQRLITVVVGMLIACAALGYFWHITPHEDTPFVTGFRIVDHVTALVGAGDSQATLTLAQHGRLPYNASYPHDTGYRWRRPLPVVLTYLAGLGQKQWMGYGMLVVSLLGVGLLIYAVADWLGDNSHWAVLIVLFPGVIASIQWLGMDPLGLGLAIIGWRKRNPWLLTAAGLVHETLLLFALHRKQISPFLVYGSWALTTFLLWGWGVPTGTLGFLNIGALQNPTLSLIAFLIGAALGFLALREDFWLGTLFFGLMFLLGPIVWWRWQDSTRLLLPLWVLGFVSAVNWLHHQSPTSDVSAEPNGGVGQDDFATKRA